MVTAQMRREGEGECNRLIMWLVALRLRQREREGRERDKHRQRGMKSREKQAKGAKERRHE